MGVKVIIDGYNLLFRMKPGGGEDLEQERDSILNTLSDYAIARKRSILVVFDGQGGTAPPGSRGRKGVKAIFTEGRESADDRIDSLSRNLREKALVITSDRELASRVMVNRSGHATVEEFLPKLEQATFISMKGIDEEAEDKRVSKTKGPARKKSKKKRRKGRYLDKL